MDLKLQRAAIQMARQAAARAGGSRCSRKTLELIGHVGVLASVAESLLAAYESSNTCSFKLQCNFVQHGIEGYLNCSLEMGHIERHKNGFGGGFDAIWMQLDEWNRLYR